jgi:hypothetical protein
MACPAKYRPLCAVGRGLNTAGSGEFDVLVERSLVVVSRAS